MTRAEARKVALSLASNGYSNVMMHESIDTGDVYVTGYNACNVRRTIETVEAAAELVRTTLARRCK